MNAKRDNVELAEWHLAQARVHAPFEPATYHAIAAQAHATLAVAEELRKGITTATYAMEP